jgi:hypothetical protein
VTPPWPCGSRARSPRGGDATSSVALNTSPRPRRVCANRPRAPCSPPPMATSRAPLCTPCVSCLDLHLHPLGLAMRTRYPAQHTRPLRDRTPTPAPRRRRRTRVGADHAANAVALLCATRRASTPRGVHGLPGGVQAPGAVGPRRRQGRVPPPPPQAHFVEHLGRPRKTAGDLSTPGGYTRE